MRKETATYQRLQSVLTRPGCPICHLCQEAVKTYLDTLLWESSTDMNMNQILRASLGFCGRHSRDLLGFGGQRLAAAVVERASLLAARRRLAELATSPGGSTARRLLPWQPRRGLRARAEQTLASIPGVDPCPACVREAHEVTRGVEVLLANWEEFAGPLQAAGGLCLPHFIQAAQAADAAKAAALLAIEERCWADLTGQLEEFIRQHMDHFHAEPISEPARLSVERTIAALTGEYPVR